MDRALQDQEAIRAVLALYARGVDRGDREALRRVYWPDAVDHHGSFDGPAYDFIEVIVPTLSNYKASTHMLGQVHAEVRGDLAVSESYFICYYVRRAPLEDYLETLTGRYADRWERRGEEWRIIERRVLIDWTRMDPPAAPIPPELARAPRSAEYVGLMSRDDPTYAAFDALRG